MSRNCEIVITDSAKRERARFRVPYGARLLADEGAAVARGQKLGRVGPVHPADHHRTRRYRRICRSDRGNYPRRADRRSHRPHLESGGGLQAIRARCGSASAAAVEDAKGEILRLTNGAEARYFLNPDSILSVEPGATVADGDVLARIPREGSKTRDITGGLPRVAELFEARRRKTMRSSPKSMEGWNSARITRPNAG